MAINPASPISHRNYCEKKGFGFPILSDPSETAITAFGCQKPGGGGVVRTVYALDPDSVVIFAERGQPDYKTIMDVIRRWNK